MPRSSPLIACLVQVICTLLVACSVLPTTYAPQASQQVKQAAASSQSGLASAGENQDIFEIDAWIDKSTLAQSEMVILNGNLQRNGVILGGIMMEASWPGDAQERNMPSCTVQVIYQRGVCYINTTNFPVGETVPVTLKFRYNEMTFTGDLSFTIK